MIVVYCLVFLLPFCMNIELHVFSSRDHDEFIAALEEFIRSPEKPLPDKLQTAINFQYKIQVRNSADPYKRAVSRFKIT